MHGSVEGVLGDWHSYSDLLTLLKTTGARPSASGGDAQAGTPPSPLAPATAAAGFSRCRRNPVEQMLGVAALACTGRGCLWLPACGVQASGLDAGAQGLLRRDAGWAGESIGIDGGQRAVQRVDEDRGLAGLASCRERV